MEVLDSGGDLGCWTGAGAAAAAVPAVAGAAAPSAPAGADASTDQQTLGGEKRSAAVASQTPAGAPRFGTTPLARPLFNPSCFAEKMLFINDPQSKVCRAQESLGPSPDQKKSYRWLQSPLGRFPLRFLDRD